MKNMRHFGAVLVLFCVSFQLHARPYASSLTNNAGTVSFRLNESADNVKIISAGGTVTNDLGALAAGLHTFALGVADPYQIEVFKVSPPGFTSGIGPNRGAVLQISTDADSLRFNQPRGVVVNTDPSSPNFGRVYVSNSQPGVTNRNVGDGIYLFNADLSDAVGQGDTARTGGLIVTNNVAPYRLSIGQDGNLYITDWSDFTGSLYVADPDVNSATNVLAGPVGSPFPVTTNRLHGSIAAAIVTGSLATGDLTAYVIDEDLQNDRTSGTQNMRNSLWRHDVGGTLPGPDVLPTLLKNGATEWINFASQTMDLSRGTNGYFYVNDYRSTGSDRSGLTVLDASGSNVLWSSLSATRAFTGNASDNDLLRATGGGDVSPMGDNVAVINIETNGITVVPLIDGVPNITNRLVFHGMGTGTGQGRDLAFDAAGNLYAVSSGSQLLRAFSPGGTSTAITGSDGTFQVLLPTTVTVAVEDAEGYETGPETLSFRVTRTGSTAEPLTVTYELTGAATNGVDYVTDPLTVTIPAGEASALVTITPIDDNEAELTEIVRITLTSDAAYNLGAPIIATGTISDNEFPVTLTITAVDTTTYERFPSDVLTFRITRRGDTNSDVFGVIMDFGGTAVRDVDYAVSLMEASLYIPPGVVNTNITLNPIDDFAFEQDESVTVTLQPNGYEVGTPGTAQATIRDDEYGPETRLFSDQFNADSSANWILTFGANTNTAPDYSVDWVFDYSTLGIPPAPGSLGVDTLGVRVTVNKNDTLFSSAGLNLYPTNQSFSGDFALRFDAYMSIGASNATEHTLAGINHSGVNTNRVSQTPANHISTAGADGIWFAIDGGGGNLRDYGAYTSTNAATVPALIATRAASTATALVTRPPYAVAGAPGNASNSTTKAWADVEIRQSGNVVTLSVNHSAILSVTNTYGFNSGNVMLGFNDQFDSRGALFNFAIFDNVRVVQLGLSISSISVVGNTVTINFVSGSGGQPSDYRIDSSPTLSPPSWSEEAGANISATQNGFSATLTVNGPTRFYRVRQGNL
jgi:hypothetical protein